MSKFTNKKFVCFLLIMMAFNPCYANKVSTEKVNVNTSQSIRSNTAETNTDSPESAKNGSNDKNKNAAPKLSRQSGTVSSDKNISSNKTSTKPNVNSQKAANRHPSVSVPSAKNKRSATKPASVTTPNNSKTKTEVEQVSPNVQNQNSPEQNKDLGDNFSFIKSNEIKGTLVEDDKILLYAGIVLVVVSIVGLYITFRHKWRKKHV